MNMQFANTMFLNLKRTQGSYALAAALAALALSGCGSGDVIPVPTQIKGPALRGSVHGGQNPVSGATIQLYQVGTSGYGSAATPLIASTVTTQADGTFIIDHDYTCASASTQVYITATQGNSGFTNNPNLSLIAALGSCGNLSTSTVIQMNEVTTIGSVWALSPFMAGPAKIGSTATNSTGIANAFLDVNTLVDTSAGVAPGSALPPGATVPTTEINTLADILAACVNSGGGIAGSTTACGTLFSAANPGGTLATAPTDTTTAAVNIAQNPALNIASLYGLAQSTPPFQPALTAQPNDFTIAVSFTGGNLSGPSALASDASGNVWIANASGNTVTEINHNGAVLSGSGYTNILSTPSAIAIDAAGGVWVANKGNNTVSKFSITGAPAAAPYSGGGLNLPTGIAFDSFGNAWVSNSGNPSVTEINNAGTTLTNYTPAGASAPLGIAVSPH
jgi:hypothetical protein